MGLHRVARVLLPVVGGVLLVGVVGLLEVRADMAASGLRITWGNEPERIVEPSAPWLHRLAVATLAAGALLAVLPRETTSGRLGRSVALWSLAAVLTGLSAWFLATTEYPYEGGLYLSGGVMTEERGDPNPVVAWLRAGALSPAVHVLALLCLALAGRELLTGPPSAGERTSGTTT